LTYTVWGRAYREVKVSACNIPAIR